MNSKMVLTSVIASYVLCTPSGERTLLLEQRTDLFQEHRLTNEAYLLLGVVFIHRGGYRSAPSIIRSSWRHVKYVVLSREFERFVLHQVGRIGPRIVVHM